MCFFSSIHMHDPPQQSLSFLDSGENCETLLIAMRFDLRRLGGGHTLNWFPGDSEIRVKTTHIPLPRPER